MAEAAVFSIVKSVLQQLASPAIDEFRLLWGQKAQLEKLESTVTAISHVLQDADRRQATDVAVQGWLARLRAALYEADDLLDAICANGLLEKDKKGSEIGKKVCHFLSKPYRFAFLVKNAHKLKKIREHIDDIACDIKRFNFLPNETSSAIERDQTYSYIARNVVIGREQETEDAVRIMLFGEYKELPYPIKRCFGYCSLFPKDYKFEKDSLVHLWIGQGFVEPLVNQSLEDRAEDYFFYLAKRCFFQLKPRDEDANSIVTYKMHDQMHDLATEVAGSESILVDQTTHSSWDKIVRHVSINCKTESIVDSVCSFSHSKSLRTFLRPFAIYLQTNDSLGNNALKKLVSTFRSLRVLDLSNLGIKTVPTSIGELTHLRFLDLSGNYMERLPRSIRSLFHLQSLILRHCAYLKELPKELGELVSLRHLLLQDCESMVQMPHELAALTSLVTLDKLVVHNPSGGLEYLEGLDNLRSLRIELPRAEWESATTDAEKSSLSRKSKLHSLSIIHKVYFLNFRLREPDTPNTSINALQPPPNLVDLSIKYFGGKELPHWVMFLHKLVILKLEGCLSFVELPSLSHLPSLKELYISDMPSMLTIEDIKLYKPDSFFPSLETLSIKNMSNLTSWWLQAPTVLPTFPHLTKVSICYCQKLTCLPLFPLADELLLTNVREEILWEAIGSEATFSVSHGINSMLKILEISRIGDLSRIAEAEIRHLSALRKLVIKGYDQLELVSWNGLAYLTSLEHLVIWMREKHNDGLDVEVNWDDHEAEVRRIHLPIVRHLNIPTMNRNLYKGLKHMASLETLIIQSNFHPELQQEEDEEDNEEGLPWKHLQKLHTMRLVFGRRFSMRSNHRLLHGFEGLISLRNQTLWRCKELYLSWRAFLGLPCLEFLQIKDIEEVIDGDSDAMVIQPQPISRSIRNLTIIGGSGEWVNDIPWKCLPFLKDLYLCSIRNMEALPEGIRHLAAIEKITIAYMDNELKKRCERLTGEDWPKIQHIPKIDIL